jgi:SAM-dependent methyltransferase
VAVAIERAKAKAAQRGIDAHFLVGNALELNRLGRQFDTVIDCGLFHTLTDEQRPVFVQGLGEVLRSGGLLYILCFSNEEPGTEGPRRITQDEIRDAFQKGWKVKQIEPTRFESVQVPGRMVVSPGGPKAWLATIQRS